MDIRQKILIAIHLVLLSILVPIALFAQTTEVATKKRITIAASRQDGTVLRKGLAFLYDANTIICSYSDLKGASEIQVQWNGASASTNRLVSFSESMDLAVLTVDEEIPLATPIVSSSTLAAGDPVSYWIERDGVWVLVQGSAHEILDTGKGYGLILIESRNYSNRSTPLYKADGKIVGWLQGKRAIPMETIASLAEKQTEMTIADLHQTDVKWKFVKPSSSSSAPATSFSFSEMKTVNGPASFSFKLDLPQDWEPPQVTIRSGQFHVRYQRSSISLEVRAAPLNENDLLLAIERAENLIFTDFLRAELAPYFVRNLTGFRGYYEEMDPINPYVLHVFYTSYSQRLYMLSIAYPKGMEEDLRELVDRVFASFRI